MDVRISKKMSPYLLSFLTFCLGLLLGHRLSLWRDRRKEFNEIAQPLREVLPKERDSASPLAQGLGVIEAGRLESLLPFWRRRAFRNDWKVYCELKKSTGRDSIGQSFYKNTESIVAQIDNVLRHTRRK